MSLARRPMMLLVPLVWLAVVLVVAGVTWRVIDSAGRHVLTSGGPPPLSASGTTEHPDDGREATDASPKHRNGHKEGSATANPSGKPAPQPSAGQASAEPGPATPSVEPTPQPSQLPEQQQPSRQPSQPPPSQPPSSEPPPSETQVRSWQGSAGTVTAACTGTRISLQSVTPNDGWAVEVDDRGPEHIKVKFESGGEDERETEVQAACSGGVPRFQVEADD